MSTGMISPLDPDLVHITDDLNEAVDHCAQRADVDQSCPRDMNTHGNLMLSNIRLPIYIGYTGVKDEGEEVANVYSNS